MTLILVKDGDSVEAAPALVSRRIKSMMAGMWEDQHRALLADLKSTEDLHARLVLTIVLLIVWEFMLFDCQKHKHPAALELCRGFMSEAHNVVDRFHAAYPEFRNAVLCESVAAVVAILREESEFLSLKPPRKTDAD